MGQSENRSETESIHRKHYRNIKKISKEEGFQNYF